MAAPTWITDACQAIEKIRKMKDGDESPIWWRILDLRPMTNRLGPANKRAKEFVTEETLKMLAPPKLISQQSAIDEETDVVLNMVKSLPSGEILAQFQKLPSIGTLGILQNLSSIKSVQMDQKNLKKFLEGNVKIEMVRMDKFDVEFGGGLSITNEKIEKLSQHADIIALASCYTVLELWHPSHYYGEADSGYPYIQITLRYTANKQSRPDSLSLSLYDDEIRVIEMGIAENVGPDHAETDQETDANSTKVFKGNRDQWEELKRVIQKEAGDKEGITYEICQKEKVIKRALENSNQNQGKREKYQKSNKI
ncbi:hypothetical protein G9A89_011112 [Geosiphon pyriformis]|nr:hypothetical protein G9A89_011112 [Geosiphon pyriformis]